MTSPGGHVQRGEQRGRPVAGVVRGPALRLAGGHRQQGLRAVQGLHLALLVDRQDDGILRRAHVQADDVADLLDEVGVGGELEGLAEVGLEAEGPPDAADGRLRQPDGLGHVAGAPVGGGLGLLLQGLGDDPLDHRVGDRPRGAGRGSSARPSSRSARKRFRHLPTVTGLTRSRAATSVLSRPSAQARTILARVASRWVLLGRAAQVSSFCRSSSLRMSGALGRPPLFIAILLYENYMMNTAINQGSMAIF